ncbi:MAG TPA: translation initiation factor 2 [Micromonosporaceae bacterium]|nr:translation initiation factor 2 [Micromonosporaceae bacterium]
MTTRSEGTTDDDFWRRPDPAELPSEAAAAAGRADAEAPSYPGPPVAPAPRPGWRPPMVVQPPPPRQLPAQDLDRLDAEERGARTVTYAIGIAAGVVLLVVIFLLCLRVVF